MKGKKNHHRGRMKQLLNKGTSIQTNIKILLASIMRRSYPWQNSRPSKALLFPSAKQFPPKPERRRKKKKLGWVLALFLYKESKG